MKEKDFRKILAKQRDLKGASALECQNLWKELGGNVDPVRKTGETRYRHPNLEKPITAGRKKDATRAIRQALLRLIRNSAEDRKEDRRTSRRTQ